LLLHQALIDTLCVDATLAMHDRPSNAADQATDKAQLKPRAVAAGAAAAPISLKARRKVSGREALHAVLDFEQLHFECCELSSCE
jgi:hypothetical protein